jgi:hypothetical protein
MRICITESLGASWLGINMNLDELVASVTEVELREGLLHCDLRGQVR